MKVKDFYELSKPLVLDGGLATELETTREKKFLTNLWSAACLFQDPDAIREVHLSYFRAGADIASTCSYQTPIDSFIEEGFTNQEAIELIQKSIHIAVEARDIFWKEYQTNETNSENKRIKPMIALALGPYGGSLSDGSEYTGDYGNEISLEKLKDFHKERLNIFKPLFSLIDFIAFETIPSYLEAESICSLLQEEKLDIPCWISFSCKNDEEISHGELFIECVQLCSKIDCIVSVGINCTKPEYISKLIKNAREKLDNIGQEKKYIICYPDGGVEYDNETKLWKRYTGISPKEFENYSKIWTELAKFKIIIGGCCKTTPDHIRSIRNTIDKIKFINSPGKD
ncbi:Homocysteine S-methyltransferase [Glomus cerebriforme]|uniref:Homocysteine S-methyltransferase n=1 Tax=Glomus cerebriforme TaxID=658196 RepID=A0A397TAN6_9GLOM|nr:Homocysteine S-methyltransferase [Glomus cerebriforme]